MKINTALILCAGLGKRLNPITLKTPKPLLKIKNLTLLEHCINLIKQVGVNKIFINSFYLKEQINKFIEENDFEIISVLRNLKIIGIFTRLAIRDNKKKYLKLIPYAWKLIKLRSQNNNFRDLNNLLKVLKKNK